MNEKSEVEEKRQSLGMLEFRGERGKLMSARPREALSN